MIQAFHTDTSIHLPAITTDQMREVDRVAIEETGPNLFQMMENAGRNLAELAMEIARPRLHSKFAVLAGTGGNGGGGICAARHLANRGLDVCLVLTSLEGLGEVPAWQLKIFEATGGRLVSPDAIDGESPDLILDALLGYSLRGAPHGVACDLIQWANAARAPKLALDVPSGVDSTTGDTAGAFVDASVTMTLALPKSGLLAAKTGRLWLADIGIPAETYAKLDLAHRSPFDYRYRVPLRPHTDLSIPDWREEESTFS